MMIVTIDGPAGAGKSTVARQLAQRLGFQFLDTGAMYRVVTLAALRAGLDFNESEPLATLARRIAIRFAGGRVLLDDEDVTDLIRTNAVSTHVAPVADNPAVRQHLIELQRRSAANTDIVTEGRDQGTLAFPNAECKIFLTASPEERARRRMRELQQRGESITLEQILAQQNERDQQDMRRPFGSLTPAPDAILVDTDGLGLPDVVERLEQIVRAQVNTKR